MMTFKDYLHKEDYAKTTIESYSRNLLKFTDWCSYQNYDAQIIDYKSCIEYVGHIQKQRKGKSVSKSTVRSEIGALKIYFNYLVETEIRFENPIQNIHIRGERRTVNHNLLDFDELEDLYYSYQTENIVFPNCPSVSIRNKIITGFMVYQGLNATALKTLRYEHLDMSKGTIYIPSTRKTNSRTLSLQSQQILPLWRYLEKDREVLQEKIDCHTQGLFPVKGDRFFLNDRLFFELRKLNHKVKNAKQIRASVITYWLSQHNIREVQYMAGHHYISSTERYQQDDLENLHELIESLHPIG
ncbi:MAG: tyrosine-type recombinase/integrase [Flavobacteriaceae bacterium]|nr:MAG: tyrosine-type recombinase/integrase [Flavobacteriaceae bacterium]